MTPISCEQVDQVMDRELENAGLPGASGSICNIRVDGSAAIPGASASGPHHRGSPAQYRRLGAVSLKVIVSLPSLMGRMRASV